MYININVSDDLISGSYGKDQFVVRFTKERYDKMIELQQKANAVKQYSDLKGIFEEFMPLTEESFKDLVETRCPYIVVNDITKEFFLTNDGVVSSIPIPQQLVDRIIESAEKGVDFMPLVKLWMRWLRNPVLRSKKGKARDEFSEMFATYISTDFVNKQKASKLMEEQGLSEEVARRFASVKDVSITQEGLLNTYKAAQEITTKYALDEEGNTIVVDRYPKEIDPDTGVIITKIPDTAEERLFEPPIMHQRGDAFFCKGANGYPDVCHFLKVGCEIALPDWSFVDCDSSHSCVKGLHVGGLTYIAGYQGTGTETFNCFVSPEHIGAFDHSGNGAIRCLKYFVHSAIDCICGNLYHSSTYAAKTDEEWAVIRKEVIDFYAKERKESIEEQNNEIAEINVL